jgi:hypothetical protein
MFNAPVAVWEGIRLSILQGGFDSLQGRHVFKGYIMSETESQYKFSLALDLIFYLIKVLLHNNQNKVEMVSLILDKWNKRIDRKFEFSISDEAKKYSEEYGVPTDVAAIIFSVYRTEPNILQKEFTDHVKQLVINSFIEEMRQDEQKKLGG